MMCFIHIPVSVGVGVGGCLLTTQTHFVGAQRAGDDWERLLEQLLSND